MNVIVSNKQKELLDNANIDAIKDLNGLFKVDDLINKVKGYFFSKIIIDATSIVDFAKENVLRKLVDGIGAERIILLLPPKPEPPRKFCDLLLSLGIKNFTQDIDDVLQMIRSTCDVNNQESIHNFNASSYINGDPDRIIDKNKDNKYVIGFKNVTKHAGSTTLIYMLKEQLEKNYKLFVEAFELGKNDFKLFNAKNMSDVNPNSLENVISKSICNVILIDLNDRNYEHLCDEVIYLIEPSIIKINELLLEKSKIFSQLHDKKVVLNKSMLSIEDIKIFGQEAGINIYFNIPTVNDRVNNSVINQFIDKLKITEKTGHGLFGLFK